MKKNGYFYYNELKEIGVLYDKYSGKIFKIPMKVAKAGKLSELNIEDEKRLDALLVNKPICKDFTDSKELNHLRLMLTNKCNFACTYCYADEGSYGFNQDEVMSSELAVDIINWGYSRYEHIKQISFFGGEPLLNLDAIESVCSHTLKLYKENKIKKLPLFSVVTNGYLLQDSVVDLIRKYKIYPVISIDGPKSVHDKQRVLKNRNGTYDVVSSNLKKLRELMPFSLEATFTSNHDLENITTDDVRNYLEKEFNVSRILVNKTYAYKDGKLSHLKAFSSKQSFDYAEYFKAFFNNKTYKYTDIMVRLINVFQKQYYLDTFCDAGLNQFAVDWDGNILPCHIFTGYSEKILGNIYNSDVLKDTENLFASKDNENCKECTDKRFCQKCLLDIENNHYRCDNFREGLNVFYENMLYLFTCEQDRYRKFTQDIMKFYKKHLEEEFENDHYTRVVQ